MNVALVWAGWRRFLERIAGFFRKVDKALKNREEQRPPQFKERLH